MKVIRQILLTIYEDGTTRTSEKRMPDRDEETGRFVPRRKTVVRDDTMPLPGMEKYV